MRPTLIPAELVWEGARRIVMSPPDGDMLNPEIAPLEMIATAGPRGVTFSARCILEDGELERLTAGGHVWITFAGHVVPFSLDVTGPDGA